MLCTLPQLIENIKSSFQSSFILLFVNGQEIGRIEVRGKRCIQFLLTAHYTEWNVVSGVSVFNSQRLCFCRKATATGQDKNISAQTHTHAYNRTKF